MWKHGENFPVYGTTHFYITTTHHPPPLKKFVLKEQNTEDDTKYLIGSKHNQPTTIQSEVSKTDNQIWPKSSAPRGEPTKRQCIWLDQIKLNDKHPIRSHLSDQAELVKILPRGDGSGIEEFGNEEESSSCWWPMKWRIWCVKRCDRGLWDWTGGFKRMIEHCCVV